MKISLRSRYCGESSGISPQAYSIVAQAPNGTRRIESAPQPLQFVPQPSATNSQALLKESTARVLVNESVSQGDQANNPISKRKKIIGNSLFLFTDYLFG
jgi:hypothetical protein